MWKDEFSSYFHFYAEILNCGSDPPETELFLLIIEYSHFVGISILYYLNYYYHI